MVFHYAQIIRSQADSSELMTQKINERIDFHSRQNMSGQDPHGKYVDQMPTKSPEPRRRDDDSMTRAQRGTRHRVKTLSQSLKKLPRSPFFLLN